MNTDIVRITIDIPSDLMRKIKIQAVQRGVSLKKIITEAIITDLVSKSSLSGEKLWMKIRRLAKAGRQDVDLVAALRRDRDSHF